MAQRTTIAVQKIKGINLPTDPLAWTAVLTPVSHTNGSFFIHDERDDKYLVLAMNGGSGTQTLTVKHGNGNAGCRDLKVVLPAGRYAAFTFDSARFKFITGEHKGQVLFDSSSSGDDMKVAVFCLP